MGCVGWGSTWKTRLEEFECLEELTLQRSMRLCTFDLRTGSCCETLSDMVSQRDLSPNSVPLFDYHILASLIRLSVVVVMASPAL